jgi:hypothetical protein
VTTRAQQAVRAIQRATGLSQRKAKRRLIAFGWAVGSDGLLALRKKKAGLPYGVVTEDGTPWRVIKRGG